MRQLNQAEFLKKLEKEAKLQASLNQTHLLPGWVAGAARLVAFYPWQVMLTLSGLTAMVLEVI